jgi:adenylate kinase
MLIERVVGRRTDPVTGKIYHMTFSPPKDEEILARLEHRSDDTEEKVKVRLGQFHANIVAIKGNYADMTIEVDGSKKPSEIAANIESEIKKMVGDRAVYVN